MLVKIESLWGTFLFTMMLLSESYSVTGSDHVIRVQCEDMFSGEQWQLNPYRIIPGASGGSS